METTTTSSRVATGADGGASRFAGLSRVYAAIVHWSLVSLFFLVPLAVLPFTVEALEVNKQTLLVFVTFIAALAWLGLVVHRREMTVRRGWLNLFPVLFVVSVLISSVLSKAGFVSWIGQSSQEYMSFLTTAAFVTLFFLLVNAAGETFWQKRAITALILSATLVAVQLLLHMMNVPVLGFLGATSRIFNTVGTVNAAAIFLIAVTMLANGLWLVGKTRAGELAFSKPWGIAINAATLILSLATIVILAALDYWVLWVVLLVGIVVLFTFAMVRAGEFGETGRFVLPMGLLVVALLLLFLPTPVHFNIPVEVTPSHSATWSIASQSLGSSSAMFGTGPGTFVQDYTQYREVELNQTSFWNVRFDRGSSHLFTILASLGIIGTFLFLLLIVSIGVRVLNRLLSEQDHAEWKSTYVLFAAWLSTVVAMALYSSNFTLVFLFFTLSGLLASQVMVKQRTISFNKSPRAGLTFSFLFVLVAVGIVTGLFVTGQRYAAEIAFAQAVKLDRTGGDLDNIIRKLDTATTYNRLSDVYYRNLSQALLLRVQKEITDGTIPPEKTQLVQQLIGSSIGAAKRAASLGPSNVANWEILGSIYREVSPIVGGADTFAIDAFSRAHELEPSNPIHLTNTGRSYIVFAENARALTGSKDQTTADAAKAAVVENLKKAEDALLASIALKSDYAPAHYYLAIVYEREGRLGDAVGKMEAVKRYNPLDVGVAFQLGLLYLRDGKYSPAQLEFERAVSLVPTYANARWFLAAIYEQQGMIDKAIEQVEKVLEMNPDNQLVHAKLERLRAGQYTVEIPEPVESGEETATEVEEGQPVQ